MACKDCTSFLIDGTVSLEKRLEGLREQARNQGSPLLAAVFRDAAESIRIYKRREDDIRGAITAASEYGDDDERTVNRIQDILDADDEIPIGTC